MSGTLGLMKWLLETLRVSPILPLPPVWSRKFMCIAGTPNNNSMPILLTGISGDPGHA